VVYPEKKSMGKCLGEKYPPPVYLEKKYEQVSRGKVSPTPVTS